MISHSHKFIFIHIPKNAGTSIEQYFIKSEVVPPHFNFNVTVHYDNITPEIAKEYFTFAFHRNPWDRFVSLWKYWMFHHEFTKKFNFPNTFEYFCYNVDSIKNSLPKEECVHFLNQVDVNGQPEYVKPEWYSFEDLDNEFKKICDRIKIPYKNLEKVNFSNHKHYKEYYTPELKKIVSQRYEKDIDTFKYNF